MGKQKIVDILEKIEKVAKVAEEFCDEWRGPVKFPGGNTGWYTKEEEDDDDDDDD